MTNINNLIEQFQNKNHNAFEKLYTMYYKSINGVIFTIVKNNEIAAELTQDVFVKAWENSGKYSIKKGRFFTWLLNIARNAAIDTTRSKSYKNSKKNYTSDSDIVFETIKSSSDLENNIDTIGLKNLVSKLDATKKEVIELLYFKGFTHQEASEKLNIPLGTVKTRNSSGLKKLRLLF